MSARPNDNSISTERVNQVFDGDANFNFTSCIVNVEGNIANHITYQSNVIIVSDPSSRGDQMSRNTGMPGNTRGVDGQAVPPPRGVPVQSHGPSPAASSLEDRWDHEITYDGDTTGKRKAKVETITAVYSRTLDDRERVYVQPSDRPLNGLDPTVLEFKPQNGNWVMANPIPLPDAAAPVTPLAAVCIAGGIEIHLFYVTSHNTIKEMAWNNEEGWLPGKLFGERLPKISLWSSLSALRSAKYIKLFYQRDEMICELSYGLGNRMWKFYELFRADRGTPIASTSYPGAKSTVYHVYFQLNGKTYVCKKTDSDRDGPEGTRMELPRLLPPQCSSLAAISWFAGGQGNIRIYYVSDSCETCEGLGETLATGTQITALRPDGGDNICVYFVSHESQSGRITLKQMVYSGINRAPEVKSIWSGFA